MRALWWLLPLWLSACSTAPTQPSVPHQAMADFTLNGRIAVHTRDERHNGGLHWQHQGAHDELLLQGPLGITVARIVSDAQSATLEMQGQRYLADDVEALMRQGLGWGLPLSLLQHWLLAQADSTLPAQIERDAAGRIAVLQQAGWTVRYMRYAEDSGLPAHLVLTRDDIEVRLLIDEWMGQ